jgi:hypothetical protein
MKMIILRRFYPILCTLLLISSVFACDIPRAESDTDVSAASTQTMEALATIVASTLDSLEAENTSSPTIPAPTDLASPTETPAVGMIVGLVWHDYNEDGVIDPGEPPMPGTAILLGEGPCESVGFMSVMTEDDGSFVFENLPAGEYCVVVFLPHGCGGYTPTVEHPRTLTVTPGVDVGGLLLGVLENPC